MEGRVAVEKGKRVVTYARSTASFASTLVSERERARPRFVSSGSTASEADGAPS